MRSKEANVKTLTVPTKVKTNGGKAVAWVTVLNYGICSLAIVLCKILIGVLFKIFYAHIFIHSFPDILSPNFKNQNNDESVMPCYSCLLDTPCCSCCCHNSGEGSRVCWFSAPNSQKLCCLVHVNGWAICRFAGCRQSQTGHRMFSHWNSGGDANAGKVQPHATPCLLFASTACHNSDCPLEYKGTFHVIMSQWESTGEPVCLWLSYNRCLKLLAHCEPTTSTCHNTLTHPLTHKPQLRIIPFQTPAWEGRSWCLLQKSGVGLPVQKGLACFTRKTSSASCSKKTGIQLIWIHSAELKNKIFISFS